MLTFRGNRCDSINVSGDKIATPEPWVQEVGIRSSYEGLVFDRTVRGKDAINRIVGVGHKVVEQAMHQARSDNG